MPRGRVLPGPCTIGLLLFLRAPAALSLPLPSPPQMDEAMAAEARGEYRQAAQEYRRVLDASPLSSVARKGLARSLVRLGRYPEAVEELTLLTAATSGDSETDLLLGICRFYLRDFEKAVLRLETAAQKGAGEKEAFIFLARSYAGTDRIPKAIRTLKSWLEENGEDANVLYWIGQFYEELSSRTLERLVETDPDHFRVHQLLGDSYALKQDYEKALEEYSKALRAFPEAPDLRFARGNVYWQTNRYDEALEDLQTELKTNPYHARAHYEIGDILVRRRQAAAAIPHLEKALALNPQLVVARRPLGQALAMQKEYERALQEFSLVAEADPEDDAIHALLANAYRALGNLEQAKKELEIYRELNQAKRQRAQER